MPDTRTLQDMLDRIADEIKTDDLQGVAPGQANIYNAILGAVIHYQREHLFANDAFDRSIVTSQGVDTYAVPDTLIAITELNLIVRGQRYPLRDESIQTILDYKTQYTVPEQGQPFKYAFYNTDTGNGEIMTWPAPDADGYVFEFVMQARIPFPPTLLTSNFWTTVAESMVRNRAKWLLNVGVTKDYDAAKGDKLLEEDAFANLLVESVQKQSTGTLKATRF